MKKWIFLLMTVFHRSGHNGAEPRNCATQAYGVDGLARLEIKNQNTFIAGPDHCAASRR